MTGGKHLKYLKRLMCLLVSLMLLPTAVPAEEEAPAPSVRVLLRRLELTDRADLILNGVYTGITGTGASIAWPRGTGLTVQVRDGELYLFFSGTAVSAGNSVELRRGASSDRGGLRFSKNGALYPGDLKLTVSGGQLQPVLTLSVEDYLLGVVPYEMSDSFPLEALKAQAVCARTYALSRVSREKAWDVVDTTNDQVYRGTVSSKANSARAVRETAGIVVTSNGALANCYYSASNGGQTELPSHVWNGKESSTCYQMTDDPYDLENPESIQKKTRLAKDGTGLRSAFLALLEETVFAEPEMEGFVRAEGAFRVDGISAVTLSSPRFSPPSRLMTKLTVTLSVSGKQYLPVRTDLPLTWEEDDEPAVTAAPTFTPAPTPVPTPVLSDFIPAGTFTVTLSLFPSVIRALGLSVYGADNEIVTVNEEKDAFLLKAGRYGHGVGMSQRGAQWMAGQYGKSFTDIISFYFPGSVLMKAASGIQPLPTVDPRLAETPGPAATPTPRPTLMPVTETGLPEGAYLASVENIEDDSSLNLRAEPATSSDILMRLYKHQKLIVLEACEDPEWVHVRTDAAEGYVMLSFLEKLP